MEIIEDRSSLAGRSSESGCDVKERKKAKALVSNKTTTLVLIADLNCKEARYERNAVLGPDTTEEGPCP